MADQEQPPVAESVERAIALARKGEASSALSLLQDYLEKSPGDFDGRMVLGSLLDQMGKADEALAVWAAGLALDEPPLEDRQRAILYFVTGQRLAKQAKDGPGVSYGGDYVAYGNSGLDKEGEKQWVAEKIAAAITAYRDGLSCDPDSGPARQELAALFEEEGRHEEALELYQGLADAFGREESLLGKGRCHEALGQDYLAIEAYQQVLSQGPCVDAFARLEALYRGCGEEDKAEEAKRLAVFHDGVPAFLGIEFTEANEAVARSLVQHDAHEKETIEGLLRDKSPLNNKWLLLICHNHHHHGAVEDQAFRELTLRGADDPFVVKVLRHFLQTSQCFCTLKGAAHALAELNCSEALEELCHLLPQDVNPAWYMDIAGALAKLDGPAVVEPLIRVLSPETLLDAPETGAFSPAMLFSDTQGNRVRCALALGQLASKPEAEAALREAFERCKSGLSAASQKPGRPRLLMAVARASAVALLKICVREGRVDEARNDEVWKVLSRCSESNVLAYTRNRDYIREIDHPLIESLAKDDEEADRDEPETWWT